MRGPDLFIHSPPKKAANPRAKIVMLNVMLVAVTEAPYCCDSGSRKTLQAYTAPRATCITTPATAITHRLPTFWSIAWLTMQLLLLLISVRQKIPLQYLSAQKPVIPSTSPCSIQLSSLPYT